MSNQKLYVYSTLSSDMRYQNHGKGGGDLPQPLGDGVFIKGGAGVANDRLVTPLGVVTEIDAEQLVYLQANEVFNLHKSNGFISVEERKHEVEAVTGDMEGRDNSAPTIPEDFAEDEPSPSTGGKKKK